MFDPSEERRGNWPAAHYYHCMTLCFAFWSITQRQSGVSYRYLTTLTSMGQVEILERVCGSNPISKSISTIFPEFKSRKGWSTAVHWCPKVESLFIQIQTGLRQRETLFQQTVVHIYCAFDFIPVPNKRRLCGDIHSSSGVFLLGTSCCHCLAVTVCMTWVQTDKLGSTIRRLLF